MEEVVKRKKLAVLVGGEFREFEYAQKSWTFLNDIENDIYFSTWDMSYENNELLNINISEEVKEEQIRKYFPNAIISIESDNFLIDHAAQKIIYHWKKLLNMVESSNIKYDAIILMRPDIKLYYENENREKFDINLFIDNMSNDIIYGINEVLFSPPPIFCFSNDILFIGEYNMIKNTFLSLVSTIMNEELFCIHNKLGKYFINNDIYVKKIEALLYVILRSVNRDLINLKFQDELIISREWDASKNLNEIPLKTLEYIKCTKYARYNSVYKKFL